MPALFVAASRPTDLAEEGTYHTHQKKLLHWRPTWAPRGRRNNKETGSMRTQPRCSSASKQVGGGARQCERLGRNRLHGSPRWQCGSKHAATGDFTETERSAASDDFQGVLQRCLAKNCLVSVPFVQCCICVYMQNRQSSRGMCGCRET